jgi:hypothetical protein
MISPQAITDSYSVQNILKVTFILFNEKHKVGKEFVLKLKMLK